MNNGTSNIQTDAKIFLLFSFKSTEEYVSKKNSFYIEPLLSSQGQLCYTADMSNELKNKDVYFKTYHTDNHFLLAVLLKKEWNSKYQKTYYHCLICDSDINKESYPSFTTQDLDKFIECNTNEYLQRRYYGDLKDYAQKTVHNAVVDEINAWLEIGSAKISTSDSINGMFVIS